VLLPQLGEANPTSTVTNAPELIRAQLAHVPVEVSLRLASARVMPEAIMALSVGDILPLPHPQHRPLKIMVDDQRLGSAAVGANGPRLACVVVNTEETL
jgi:flagellar motor switch protein FliM